MRLRFSPSPLSLPCDIEASRYSREAWGLSGVLAAKSSPASRQSCGETMRGHKGMRSDCFTPYEKWGFAMTASGKWGEAGGTTPLSLGEGSGVRPNRSNLTLTTLFCILLLIISKPTFAGEDYPVHFTSISSNEGLSQGFVSSIFQDKKGFMWFATKDGLNKYDGYTFTVYRHDADDSNSIADNFITCVYEDSRGYLWVATANGGIDIFNRETEKFYPVKGTNNPGSALNECRFMHEDAYGNMWFNAHSRFYKISIKPKENATNESFGKQFIYSILPATEVLSDRLHTPVKENADVFFDYVGNIWCAQGDSVYEITKDAQMGNGEIQRFSQAYFFPLTHCKILNVLSNKDDDLLYFITTAGISTYNLDQKKLLRTSSFTNSGIPTLNDCAIDNRGNIWVNFNEGLYTFNPTQSEYRKGVPSNMDNALWSANCIQSICSDRSGLVWLGTTGFGIFSFNPRAGKFHTIRAVQGQIGGVTRINGDNNGYIYLNSIQHNILFNPKDQKIEGVKFTGGPFGTKINGNEITSPATFIQDKEGIFWMGYGFGYLARYDQNKNAVKFYHVKSTGDKTSLSNVWIDNSGNICMTVEDTSSQCYICHFDALKETFTDEIAFPEKTRVHNYPFISAIQNGANGQLWLGTTQGLFCFHTDSRTWTKYVNKPGDKNSLSNNMVFSLCTDPLFPEKYLWVGTNSGGLNCMDIPSGTFNAYTEKNGLPNNVIYGMLSDSFGNLWLSTNKGLCRFNRETKECKNYYAIDGLQGNEFNRYAYYKTKSGELFFGGVNGLSFFNPKEINNEPHLSPISFTGFRLFNRLVSVNTPGSPISKPIDYLDEIVLAHDQNTIGIEFAAMDFTAPEKNQYQYKLVNFDKDWISPGTRHEAIYTNLYPGNYKFIVKAANSEGVWNELGRSINIIVLPPWWQRWWARAIFILLGIGAIAALIWLREQNARRRQQLLTRKVEERTRELNESLEHLRQTQEQLMQQEKLSTFRQLTAGVAHEIQNPLNFVNNFAEMSEELLDEIRESTSVENRNDLLNNLKQCLDKIAHHGKRADSIVKSMLAHARTSSGKKQPTDLNQMCKEFLELSFHGVKANIRDFNCTIEKHFEEKLPKAEVIPQEMSRVLINLFNNAFYAVYDKSKTDKSFSPTVSVTTRDFDHSFYIIVSDNGKGIPENIQQKIFEPFFTTKPSGEGTGLGLSISYEIIKAHGGQIKVASEPGNGTTFSVILPYK